VGYVLSPLRGFRKQKLNCRHLLDYCQIAQFLPDARLLLDARLRCQNPRLLPDVQLLPHGAKSRSD
jgi:hypothetical protein